MLLGRVDGLINGNVCGWSFNSEAPTEHLVIRVMQGAKAVASGVANIPRADLPGAGIGDGDHSFKIPLPSDITRLDGLAVIAQSAIAGEIALPTGHDSDRRLDQLFSAFSSQYEEALFALKAELDATKKLCQTLEKQTADQGYETPAGVAERLARLESRMEAAEVFFVRIDETVRRLAEDARKTKRKRIFGIF
ncbi:hypothetical protein JJB09_23440 [Rhizobium sp. KVB221]|uniref:Uncharacterized protein n=1 Tax=Rhizobium setariae TaxID=2801340 RepID=A0A936YU12_9HYPH|nr:hypothetical protein [Rhizobium setariae]MBL0374972.1 hypothetical protein [Rhizobium setariae]